MGHHIQFLVCVWKRHIICKTKFVGSIFEILISLKKLVASPLFSINTKLVQHTAAQKTWPWELTKYGINTAIFSKLLFARPSEEKKEDLNIMFSKISPLPTT